MLVIAGCGARLRNTASDGLTLTSTAPRADSTRGDPARVAASLTLRARPIARYCGAGGMSLGPCHGHQQPVTPEPQRLLQVAFIAARSTARARWYAWDLTSPRGCSEPGASGHSLGPVQTGERVVFDVLIPPGCDGTARVFVLYVTDSLADSERSTLVGRAQLPVP